MRARGTGCSRGASRGSAQRSSAPARCCADVVPSPRTAGSSPARAPPAARSRPPPPASGAGRP
eukprot:1896102-Prymnesium_polylepis.1